MRFASALSLSLFLLGPQSGRAESGLGQEARWFDATAQACADGSAEHCAARREAIASGAYKAGGPALPIGGPSDKLSASKVRDWIERVRARLAGAGGGGFVEKVGALLNLLEAHGGDIKQALATGKLLPLAQEALGLAKEFIVKKGLGDGHLIDKIQAELPLLASRLQSNQLNVDGLLQKLKQDFEGSPHLQAFGGAPPPHGPPSAASTVSLAAEKFNSRLKSLLPQP